MRYFPISIDTKGKNILILGGGETAYDYAKDLIKSEFKIYIIADDFCEEILKLKDENSERIMLKGRRLKEDFVFFGYDYCIIATSDMNLNDALEDRAKKSSIPYLRSDNIGGSAFMISTIAEYDKLSVALSGENLNPVLSKMIVEDLKNVLLKYDPAKLRLLNELRQTLILKNAPDIDDVLNSMAKKNFAVIKNYIETLKEKPVDIVKDSVDRKKEDKNDTEDDQNTKEVKKV
ncbi:MAG: NAD(P)-dependent oxidoreductase [Tissierellia bacterium]|nr:NAD(P)-dependent oxidoreductase [Tissierellia bacterium]